MTTKYIPGPWEAGLRTVRAPETKDWPELNVKIYGCNNSVARPTVRLIAAAPEMIGALIDAKQLLDALRMDSGVGEILTDSQRELYKAVDAKVTAAIAKAKGQAE